MIFNFIFKEESINKGKREFLFLFSFLKDEE